MEKHTPILAALVALAMIVGAALVLAFNGFKDETLLAILSTGAVGIASTIAGVKPSAPPPGTTQVTATTTPPDKP